LFLQDCKELEPRIRRDIAAGDVASLARTAHKLKTSAGTIGGTRAYHAALALETAARSDGKQSISEAAEQLHRALVSLQLAVNHFLSSHPAMAPAPSPLREVSASSLL